MSTELIIPAQLPETPIVLANQRWMQALATLESNVASLQVTDAKQAEVAAEYLQRATKAGSSLERMRKDVLKPYLDLQKRINTVAAQPKTRIEACKNQLKDKLAAWQELERARLAEERRQAEEELRKLEEKKQQQAADEGALSLDFDDDGVGEPVESIDTQLERASLAVAATPTSAKTSGVAFIARLVPEIQDIDALPAEFVIRTPNKAAIQEKFCRGWKDGDPLPTLPGVIFTVERTARATGK